MWIGWESEWEENYDHSGGVLMCCIARESGSASRAVCMFGRISSFCAEKIPGSSNTISVL